MSHTNIKILSIRSVACLALLTAWVLSGCTAENDYSALACFTKDCKADDGKDKKNSSRSCDFNVDGLYNFPDCYSSIVGKTLYNEDNGTIYACEYQEFSGENEWTPQYDISSCGDYEYDDDSRYSSSSSKSQNGEYTIPKDCDMYAFGEPENYSCYTGNLGTTMYNEYFHVIYVCEYNEKLGLFAWKDYPDLDNCGDYTPPKYNVPESSSSVSSSSSSPYLLSDSSPVACGNLWCGPEGDNTVNTGFDDASHTSGIWNIFDDSGSGGTSYLSFPTEQTNGGAYLITDIVDDCNGGICGIANLNRNGSGIPYTGLYFNLVNNKMDGANITDWGGICITYQTTESFVTMIELVPEGYPLTASDADNYVAQLDPEKTMANIPWSGFVQETGGYLYLFQQDLFLTQVAAIKIVMKGTSGTSGAFRITSIGKYGSCK